MVFVVPDICCSKNPTSFFYVVCSAPGPMSLPDTISNLTLYNWVNSLVGGYPQQPGGCLCEVCGTAPPHAH